MWSSQVCTVTTFILEKYGKNIPSITVLYTIKGVSCCNRGQIQRLWVPIQIKSVVKVQTAIKYNHCYVTGQKLKGALVDGQGKTLEGKDIELSP